MSTKVQIFGRGHHLTRGLGRTPIAQSNRTILVKRRWRLGDIIMCEPPCRRLSATGASVIFCTGTEYHAIVQCFPAPSPKVMSYPPPTGSDIRIADSEIDLDTVTLHHEGYATKVDAFLAAAGIPPESIPLGEKAPRVTPHPRHESWARMRLTSMGIIDEPAVGIVRSPYDANGARSLPERVINELGKRLSKDYHVIYMGATPVKIEQAYNVHNMTGVTPDVMSAAALMMNLRVLITVDTGLMHLGGAVGAPMVTVMGPTRPEDLATIYPNNTILDLGRECSPCYDRGCDSRCMESASVDEIYDLALSRADHPDSPTVTHRQV